MSDANHSSLSAVESLGREVTPFQDSAQDLGLTIRGAQNEFGLHGPVQFVDADNAVIQQAEFSDGKLHGLLERFDKGVKVFEQEFVKGHPHGVMRTYSGVDLVSEQFFEAGQLHGLCRLFSGGVLIRECVYVSGQMHGEVSEYNTDGGIIRREYYQNGLKDGVQTVFWPDGRVLQTQEFRNGIPVAPPRQYSQAGKLVTKTQSDQTGIIDTLVAMFSNEDKK